MTAIRCLVFSPDAGVREWLVQILGGAGLSVSATGTIAEALEALRGSSPFDLAVTTACWRDLDAVAWARRVRADGFAVPIVVIVPYADPQLARWLDGLAGVVLLDRHGVERELWKRLERAPERDAPATPLTVLTKDVRGELPRRPA